MTLKVDILSECAKGILLKVSANPPDSGVIRGNPYNPIFLLFQLALIQFLDQDTSLPL